jgi:PRC-barrel domain
VGDVSTGDPFVCRRTTGLMRSPHFVFLALLVLPGLALAQSTPPATSFARFVQIDDDALLSSRLIGIDVRNASGEDIGKIEDMALAGGQLVGVVVSVRAILGGQRYIAVDPASISIKYTESENTWKATLNAQIDDLKAAPEFRYEGKWRR